MSGWVHQLRSSAGRERTAMVSVLAAEGSVPREPGSRMVVTAGGVLGTIGGGRLEYNAIEQARRILAYPPGTWRIQDYPLGPLLGQCCGGRVRLLIEHVDRAHLAWTDDADEDAVLVTTLTTDGVRRERAATGVASIPSARGEPPAPGTRFQERVGRQKRPVYLFGAGHVGRAIVRLGTELPFHFAWFDTRPDAGHPDGVVVLSEHSVDACVTEAPSEAAILILTHDHDLDYRLARAVLRRDPCAFVGLIGSATKRARFLSRLDRDGVSAADCARLVSPIGIGGIPGKEPEVIAVSVLAQLLRLGEPPGRA